MKKMPNVFCLLKFWGVGNVEWLVPLPLTPGVVDLEVEINHPWTTVMVVLKYRGSHPKRKDVIIYEQETEQAPPPTYRPTAYRGDGHGLFT